MKASIGILILCLTIMTLSVILSLANLAVVIESAAIGGWAGSIYARIPGPVYLLIAISFVLGLVEISRSRITKE